MIKTGEKINGDLSEADFAIFKQQLEAKKDREFRVQQTTEAWNRFLLLCKEQRCTLSPMMIATERGNVFQFQIIAND